jgi:2-C-methyl-D-erythritol 4-phosphate cytidylyltransferase
MTVVALVPAAGRGERLGADIPKALVPVRGEPLLTHALRGLFQSRAVQYAVVAAPPGESRGVTDAVARLDSPDRVHVIPGGPDRTSSVALALAYALARLPRFEVVLVHDAARAFAPPELIHTVACAVRADVPAVIPVLPVADTVKLLDAAGMVVATPDRAALAVVQTPQGFTVDLLRRAHAAVAEGQGSTDDAGLVERLGEPVATVPGHPYAMKVTTPFDLAVAEHVLADYLLGTP